MIDRHPRIPGSSTVGIIYKYINDCSRFFYSLLVLVLESYFPGLRR